MHSMHRCTIALVVALCALSGYRLQAQNISFKNVPALIVTNTRYTITINSSTAGTVDIKSSDDAMIQPSQLVVTAGADKTFAILFVTAGKPTITASISGGGQTNSVTVLVTTSSQAAISECGSCYATLGAGAVLVNTKFGDYNNSSNILQTTHLGASTPQFVAGLAYKLPIREPFPHIYHNLLWCTPESFFNPASEGQAAFCYPWKVFASLKFSPDSSQTFNGFTYGVSHAIHKRLDILIGISYSAHNEISPGFLQAAINTVTLQKAAGNKYYSQWDVNQLKANGVTAFDGFPTQLLNSDGTTGSLIYSGNPLVLHYHSGLFLGISVPISFQSVISGGK